MPKTEPTLQGFLDKVEDPSAFLEERGVGDWDWAVFGDGSGTVWDKPCAWASVAVHRRTKIGRLFAGSANAGTNNVAEALAYVQPLLWIGDREGLLGDEPKPAVRIAVASDSEIVVKSRTGDYRSNPMHAIFDGVVKRLERRGGVFTWLHLNRLAHSNNTAADGICGLLRRLVPAELGWENSRRKV